MKHQCILFLTLILFHFSKSPMTASNMDYGVQEIEFVTSKSSYSTYENEYITICLEEVNQQSILDFEGKEIDLQIQGNWENFNTPNHKIVISRDGNCFHLKTRKSTSSNDITYIALFNSNSEDISFTNNTISIEIKKANGSNQKLNKNHIYIKGIDSSIDNDGTDKIILGNTVPISPFTSFSISSQLLDSMSSGYSASYNFMYTGDHDMEDDGIFCILISDTGYQAFGDIPDISISFNGSDFTPFFSITNALPSPTNNSFIPSNQPNIISLNQGMYFENSIGEIDFFGNTISDVGINVGNGGPSGNPNLNPGIDFSPTGDFNAIFVCDGQLYFCDLADLFSNPSFWNFENGGDSRDDFDEDTCIDFCSIIDNDCSAIGYEVSIEECEIVFSLEDCTILSDSDIKIYYKNSNDCGSPVGYTEILNPNFTTIKTSPTNVDIIFPLTYAVGCYQIEVFCDECLSPIIKEIEVNECCPFTYTLDQNIASCLPDGYIDIEITGVGSPPFTYVWSSGQSTEDISLIDEGDYSVTVTDNYGCQFIIDTYLESCCCLYTLDFGGPGLEIADIYTNDQWLSTTNQFSFPYDNNGETSSSATLLDLAIDLNNYESPQGGSAYLQAGIVYVESCSTYDYIIGNNILGKNDDCENTDVSTIQNDCEYTVNTECNLSMDIVSNNDCSLDVIISDISGYTVDVEYYTPESGVWTTIITGLVYDFGINYGTTGIYRLRGIGEGACKDVLSCELDHVCCECSIASIDLLGDYLDDGEICMGIDSLGFRVTTQDCLNNTNVEVTLPDGNTQMLVEVSDDVYEIMISSIPNENDSGLYSFKAEDSYSCFDIEEYEVEVENCDLCSNCELLLPITSNSPGKINIYEFSASCGIIDSFEISWYLNEVNEQNILFKTGTSEDVFNHPLYGFPIQGGTIIPVLNWISVSGDYYDENYPGIGYCLDSIIVLTPGCGDSYYTSYNYANGGFPDRVIDYNLSNTANYVSLSFRGYNVNDTIKVTNNNVTLFHAVIGLDAGGNDYNSTPKIFSTKYLVPYLLDINEIDLASDSTLRIEIFANKTQPITKWNFNILCIDDYECGELGLPDYENVNCEFDSINCKYLIYLLHPGSLNPQYLPYKNTFKLNTKFEISKSICSDSIEYEFESDDYCNQDSFSVEANANLGTYTLTFYGNNGFYEEVKSELLALVAESAADCEYSGNIGYYKRTYISLKSGTECIEDVEGDGSNTTYSISYFIHPCTDNFTFIDNEKQITFKKTQINNYQNNNCDECKSYINKIYVKPIGYPVSESNIYLDKTFYKIEFRNIGFKYIPFESLVNYDNLYRYMNYYDFAEELCQTDSCLSQNYQLTIDDFNDGCNNFTIHSDSNPCDNTYDFDSLVYQISNGVETFTNNIEIAEFFRENSLTSIIDNHTIYESDAKVYPNPAFSSINLEYTSDDSADVEVAVYDRAMKLITDFPWKISRGVTKKTLDISAYHDGLYFIRFMENEKSLYKKFIVINN